MKQNQEWILDLRDGTYLKGKGPVELMQTACKEAGVQEVYQVFPGDFYYDTSVCAWKQAKYKENFTSVHFVIPAPEPEPGPYQKTFCPECGFGVAVDEEGLCVSCGMTAVGQAIDKLQKPEPEKEKPCPNCHWTAEWQVAEPGGIGCGGTGGPL